MFYNPQLCYKAVKTVKADGETKQMHIKRELLEKKRVKVLNVE